MNSLIKALLVSNFNDLEKELGKQPSSSEFYKEYRCHSDLLEKVFGKPSWGSFLKYLGKNPLHTENYWNRDLFVEKYKELSKELKHDASLSELYRRYNTSNISLQRYFGKPAGYNFFKYMGLNPKVQNSFNDLYLKTKLFCEKNLHRPAFSTKSREVCRLAEFIQHHYKADKRVAELHKNFPSQRKFIMGKNVDLLRNFYLENNYLPSRSSDITGAGGFRLSRILNQIKTGVYGEKLQKEFKKYKTGKTFKKESYFDKTFTKLLDYIDSNAHLPSSRRDGISSGLWILCNKAKRGEYGEVIKKNLLLKISGIPTLDKYETLKKVQALEKYEKEHGHLPTLSDKDNFGPFASAARSGYCGKKLQEKFLKYLTFRAYYTRRNTKFNKKHELVIKQIENFPTQGDYSLNQRITELREYCLENGAPLRSNKPRGFHARFIRLRSGKYGKELQEEFNKYVQKEK